MAEQEKRSRFIVVVLTPDRVGLLRDITGTVFEAGGNIGSIRQTVLDGYFNLVFTVEFEIAYSETELDRLLKEKFGKAHADATVSVTRCPDAAAGPVVPVGASFVAMTVGEDKPGTIFRISSFFVAKGINIEDWGVSQDEGRVVYIAQVVVPEAVDFRRLQTAFKEEMAQIGLTAMICHENIFRATNEIGPIKALLDKVPL
ncbi:MAG: hypothetical protein J6Z49_12290 [Kiritimatiellae bacterium]|nr:hypothetical protein [Kiritimatiellia bacterium]